MTRLDTGRVVLDRFEVGALAASGGAASVYRCRDRDTGGEVALKVQAALATVDWQRFEREAGLLSELRHPGVVRYVAHGQLETGDVCLAMEWLEGESLQQRLARGALGLHEAALLGARIAEVLAMLHERGVVHRDLKPSNIFLEGAALDAVKLIDFGIAGLRRGASITMAGAILGTPGYMAPEQARGEGDVDARADLFSLGCVLFECLAGRPPFPGDDAVAVLAKILVEDAPPLADLRPEAPPELCAVVEALLQRDRAARPAGAGQVAAELRSLDLPEGILPPPTPPALTGAEQRLLCLLLIDRRGEPFGGARVTLRTGEQESPSALPALRRVVEAHQGRLEELAGGALVATWSGGFGAKDHAVRAVRCALELRPLLPASPIAIATGRGIALARSWAGEAIDRAARLVRAASPGTILLDEVTAHLAGASFELREEGSGFALEKEREGGPARRTLLGRPSPWVGRDRELDALEALYEECAGEPLARAVLVTGPAGVGKSRLLEELTDRLRRRPDAPQIWIGRGDPLRAGSPFGLLASAMRSALGIRAGEPAEVRAGKLRGRISRVLPAADSARVAEFLGDLLGTRRPASLESAQLSGDQLRRAFEEWVAAECATQPVVLVLEDLHWGDLPTIKFAEVVLRNLAARPLFVIGLARPEVHDLFPGLWSQRRLDEVRLAPLAPRASARLARLALGEKAAPAVIDKVVAQANGNALHLEELIRAAAEGREAPPQTVLVMLQARLEQLDAEARHVLRAASIFGQRSWAGGVAALAAGLVRKERVVEWLAFLADEEMIGVSEPSRFPGEDEHAFRHALVREAAYDMLTDADRALGHRLARAWLEEHGEAEALVLAEHCERGGEPEKAVGFYRRAAEQALKGDDIDAGLSRARRALSLEPVGETRGALLLLCAEAHGWRGEHTEAARCAEAAMEHLPTAGNAWFAAAGQAAEAIGKLGDRSALLKLGETLLGEERELDGPQAIAWVRTAAQLFLVGRGKEAGALVDRVAAARQRLAGDARACAFIDHGRSVGALFIGDLGAYRELKSAAVDGFERAGDRRNACSQRAKLGYASMLLGAYAEAEQNLRAALAEAAQMGLQAVTASAWHNLGFVLAMQGRLPEAEELERKALAAFHEQGDNRLEQASRAYLGHILQLAGDLEGAATEMRLAVSRSTSRSPSRAHALAWLAEVLLAQGHAQGALDAAGEAMRLLEELGGMDEGEARVRLARAESLRAVGSTEEARAVLEAAAVRLEQRAARFTEPRWRQSFLDNVPENARTLSLREEWRHG